MGTDEEHKNEKHKIVNGIEELKKKKLENQTAKRSISRVKISQCK